MNHMNQNKGKEQRKLKSSILPRQWRNYYRANELVRFENSFQAIRRIWNFLKHSETNRTPVSIFCVFIWLSSLKFVQRTTERKRV